eukprot:TRINITY_DN35755_c0_g1_i1.p1 TRINITY_DN35755_c0_g1~~TRINITY_DN35755_c0_g1_i1.p1  ORF type:complete len:379 (+),score=54.43 TRINITY_DN35755_c0_g1_i1:76-1137(+)
MPRDQRFPPPTPIGPRPRSDGSLDGQTVANPAPPGFVEAARNNHAVPHVASATAPAHWRHGGAVEAGAAWVAPAAGMAAGHGLNGSAFGVHHPPVMPLPQSVTNGGYLPMAMQRPDGMLRPADSMFQPGLPPDATFWEDVAGGMHPGMHHQMAMPPYAHHMLQSAPSWPASMGGQMYEANLPMVKPAGQMDVTNGHTAFACMPCVADGVPKGQLGDGAASNEIVKVTSLGSAGHPHSCAKPCKFFFTRRGCKDADKCSHCHLCEKEGRKNGVSLQPPSTGSVGHPDQCAAACKFYSKTRGCMDGASCVRCHLCPWSRSTMRAKNGAKAAAKVPAAAEFVPEAPIFVQQHFAPR